MVSKRQNERQLSLLINFFNKLVNFKRHFMKEKKAHKINHLCEIKAEK